MSIWQVKLNPDGTVAQIAKHPVLQPGFAEAPEGFSVKGLMRVMMGADGTWTLRPSLPVPAQSETALRWEGCPAEMLVEVYDGETHALLGATTPDSSGVIELAFPDAGPYRIEARAGVSQPQEFQFTSQGGA